MLTVYQSDMKRFVTRKNIQRSVFAIVVIIVLWLLISWALRTPSNDREWTNDQTILPYAEFHDESITVRNIRNFEYHSRDTYTANYYDKTFRIDEIVSVDYIVEPLASVAAAHTLLSFGLSDGSRIAISVEIRKEQGEEFSPTMGTFREYELMYVVVDERDALGLRAIYRENPVYIYPTIATPEMAQQLFMDMMHRATKLVSEPEFYNTFTNTCATNIADHINEIVPERIGWDYRLLLPKDSDALAYELGLLVGSGHIETLRANHYATDAISEHIESDSFSRTIREDIPGFSTTD